ncbi:MAG: zf-HC2 domain-containing protein [Gemmatimonadales bacterium]
MSHRDEGFWHAVLDGEVASSELAAMDQHLRECPDCRAKFEEARAFRDEAAALVVALDPVPAMASLAVRPITTARPRRRWPIGLAWAATILGAVGLGYSMGGLQARPSAAAADLAMDPEPRAAGATEGRVADAKERATNVSPAGASAEERPADASPTTTGGRSQASADFRPPVSPQPERLASAPAPNRQGAKDEADVGPEPAGKPSPAAPSTAAAAKVAATTALADASLPDSSRRAGRLEEAAADTGTGLERKTSARPSQVAPAAERVAGALRARGGEASGPTSRNLYRLDGPAPLNPADQRRRTISAVAAITALGGSIRLVDGFTPTRFEQQGDLIRVVYRTALGPLILEQWRTGELLAHELIPPANAPADSILAWERRVR